MSGGKWKNSMNMRPRDLPAMSAPSLPTLLSDAEVAEYLTKGNAGSKHALKTDGVIAGNACDFVSSMGNNRIVDMLGHSNRAVELDKNSSLTYQFELADTVKTPVLTTALVPTQPNDNGTVRYSVSVDGGAPVEFDLKEPFRSERWKLNVLRGQAVRKLELPSLAPGKHTFTITALDPHIVVDQWSIDHKPNRRHYLIPVAEK